MKKPKTITSHNRVLEISDDSQMITLQDTRFYRRHGKFYPSITSVLKYYPKGKYFEEWLKKVGYASNYILKKSGEEGTQVHEMAEQYLKGEELRFLSSNGFPLYDVTVWRMFIRFVTWWELYKPELLETEVHLFSDKYKIAGTCDLVCRIDGELWIIDFKTSNYLQTTYDLQAAAYGQCYEECYGQKPDRYGILWLKSSKRKAKVGAMQGNGWEMYESKRTQAENMDIFENVKKLYDLENPRATPVFQQFQTVAKRKM